MTISPISLELCSMPLAELVLPDTSGLAPLEIPMQRVDSNDSRALNGSVSKDVPKTPSEESIRLFRTLMAQDNNVPRCDRKHDFELLTNARVLTENFGEQDDVPSRSSNAVEPYAVHTAVEPKKEQPTTERPIAARPIVESAPIETNAVGPKDVKQEVVDAKIVSPKTIETAVPEIKTDDPKVVEAKPIERPIVEQPKSELPTVEQPIAARKVVESAPIATNVVEPRVTKPEVVDEKIVQPNTIETEVPETKTVETIVAEIKPIVRPIVVEPKDAKPEVVDAKIVAPKAFETAVHEAKTVETKVVETKPIERPTIEQPKSELPMVEQPIATRTIVESAPIATNIVEPRVIKPEAADAKIATPEVAEATAGEEKPIIATDRQPAIDIPKRQTPDTFAKVAAEVSDDVDDVESAPHIAALQPTHVVAGDASVMRDIIANADALAASARTSEIAATVSEIVEAVSAQIEVTPSLIKGEGEIVLRLKPTVLDGSEIKLTAKSGELSIVVAPATQHVAQVVSTNIPQLERALAEHLSAFSNISVMLRKKEK